MDHYAVSHTKYSSYLEKEGILETQNSRFLHIVLKIR